MDEEAPLNSEELPCQDSEQDFRMLNVRLMEARIEGVTPARTHTSSRNESQNKARSRLLPTWGERLCCRREALARRTSCCWTARARLIKGREEGSLQLGCLGP